MAKGKGRAGPGHSVCKVRGGVWRVSSGEMGGVALGVTLLSEVFQRLRMRTVWNLPWGGGESTVSR